MKVALVYDRVNKLGGAERVLLALHELYPEAPIYTSVLNSKKALWANVFNIITSFLQKLPHAASHHELLATLMPIAFESFSFDEFDLVISITSESAKGIITKPTTKHICYCLTPTRYLWSGYDEYFKNQFFKILAYPLVSYLRTWDKIAANRPDFYIAISNEVKKRIKKYYDLESEVVYPPLYISSKKRTIKNNKSNFFLVVSRLIAYKRIDLAIEACNALQLPLKIIGTGHEEKILKKIAGPSVEFLGNLTDDKLIVYYTQAKALLCPGIEDFGLTIIEAQKYGTPVIAFRGGGALETIIERKTGLFFDKQKKDSLIQTLNEFSKYNFNSEDCVKQAAAFSFKKFKANFTLLVDKVI